MRLFIALWPPAEVVATIESLPRPTHPAVRWTTAAQWHVTLRFLGEVSEGDAAEVAKVLRGVALPAPALTVGPTTRVLGRTTLVAPVEGAEAIAAAVGEATARIGETPDARPFRGHLTLARGRGRRPIPRSLAGAHLEAAWTAHDVAVVRSHRDADGARYDTVARIPLRVVGG